LPGAHLISYIRQGRANQFTVHFLLLIIFSSSTTAGKRGHFHSQFTGWDYKGFFWVYPFFQAASTPLVLLFARKWAFSSGLFSFLPAVFPPLSCDSTSRVE